MLLHNTKKEFKKWRKLWTNLEENRLEPLREHGNDGKKVELHELQNKHNREVVQHNENETQSNELGNKGQSGNYQMSRSLKSLKAARMIMCSHKW